MSKYVIDSSTLTSIADAVRAKTGKTATIKVSDIPTEISKISGGGGTEIPSELLNYSGNCNGKFSYDSWNWIIENYGNEITTSDIYAANDMFYWNSSIESIPFQLNFKAYDKVGCDDMFYSCAKLKEISDINDLQANSIDSMFYHCYNLRYLPNFNNCSFSNVYKSQSMFTGCRSLRYIPESFLKGVYSKDTAVFNYTQLYYQFNGCFSLDEIIGLNPTTGVITSDGLFYKTFQDCYRLKDIIFATQKDGTPYTCKWKNQRIHLNTYVGFVDDVHSNDKNYILNSNSGITADKEVTDDASYQLLKNDPDWFTCNVAYSRYNHDSAVRTINSLPDTSAYLASFGGTNTITFSSNSGAKTDGGAISNLTSSEIAVATAKGWTVTLV